MLQDYRELATSLKEKFQSITTWPEIEFNAEDRRRIKELDDVTNVDKHSFQIKIESNHCVIPGQYILYAICIKELALAVKEHMDFFETVKTGKSANEIGALLTGRQFDFTNISKDAYSKTLGLKIFSDNELNQGAKSIVNGSAGDYTIRGVSDFYTSIILKPINIPSASSSILGKFIYKLTEHPDLYKYLEKRFINQLPYITKEQTITKFVRNVVSFLLQYDGMGTIKSAYTKNAEPSLISIRDSSISLTSIFKTSATLLDEVALSQGNRIRFFKEPLYYNTDNEFVYLSTEWTDGTNSRLDLSSFKALIEKHYPEFILTSENGTYYLKNISGYNYNTANPSEINLNKFNIDLTNASLQITGKLVARFVCSLLTKPFVILTGLAGSGKTKLAQAFAMWICENETQYKIVPVGADWTNREPLLGYPNGLLADEYITPDSGVINLLMEAVKKGNENKPFFLILDEMNLSHVERYFADFLSIMESNDSIKLYTGNQRKSLDDIQIPFEIGWPKNIFIIGTVNIDETTYMFSPKVLDRANVIEFRITENEIQSFLGNPGTPDLTQLTKQGVAMAKSFLALASHQNIVENEAIANELVSFFRQLQPVGAEFGYRSAKEILQLAAKLKMLEPSITDDECLDIAIMQKLLPKLHGSRTKLVKILIALAGLCVVDITEVEFEKKFEEFYKTGFDGLTVKYPISFEKLIRMYKNVLANGFTSYAEA